jgi:hypothetical protein
LAAAGSSAHKPNDAIDQICYLPLLIHISRTALGRPVPLARFGHASVLVAVALELYY